MSSSPTGSSHVGPSRTRRITRACDRCHRSNARCARSSDPDICKPCLEYGDACTYDRPVRRRGPRPRAIITNQRGDEVPPSQSWSPNETIDEWAVEILVEGYRTIVYPIFPLFHWPSFIRDIKIRRYTVDRSFYVVTMAVCAIVSARLRDGAKLVSPQPLHESLSSEQFHRLAADAFPGLSEAKDFNYKRGKVLLAILCLQYGDIVNMEIHMGDYVTLSLIEGFYDEGRWPEGLLEPEIQERRRLFWSMYTLEIFSAVTWGGIVRHRQSQCNVQYPAEVFDDQDITDLGCILPTDPDSNSFIHGWNVTTDMYRVLEHLVDRLRSRRFQGGVVQSPVTDLLKPRDLGPTAIEILATVQAMYNNLRPVFKTVHAMVGVAEIDRVGFQAANLIVTLHTIKMVVAGAEESSIEQRCAIAGTLLDALSTIPTAYIAAISAPMLHHLASVGHLLAGVISLPLTQWSFLQIRNVLYAMANLISGLESVLIIRSEISQKLKAHVTMIDERMKNAAAEAERSQVFHNALPKVDNLPLVDSTPLLACTEETTEPLEWLLALSPDHQVQLQSDLTMDWPFDIGSNSLFDNWELGQP